jgi:putative membrane protein insertion efficiency factor
VSGLHPLRLIRRVAVLPIVVYRRWISPWTPPSCRFRPTCSAYTEEAILVHGILKGVLLGAWRILRCHPFARGGREPVPPRGRWRAQP